MYVCVWEIHVFVIVYVHMLYTFICSHILSAIWLYLHVFRSCPLTDRMLFTWCIEKCLTTGVVTTVTTLPPTTMCIIAFFRWNKRPLDTIHPYRKTISWCNNDPFLVDWGLLCIFSNKGLFFICPHWCSLNICSSHGSKI